MAASKTSAAACPRNIYAFSGGGLGIGLAYVLIAALLIVIGDRDDPNLHTMLDTAGLILAGVVAWVCWDIASRTGDTFVRWLALVFCNLAVLNFLHTSAAVEWSGFAIPIPWTEVRLATWAPTTIIFPLGVGLGLVLLDRMVDRLAPFAIGLLVLSVALLYVFIDVPRYTSPEWLGITRPALIFGPLLWLIVLPACWWMRKWHRLMPSIVLAGAVALTGGIAMLYSQAPHDAPAMVAHVAKSCAYLIILFGKIQVAAWDMRERARAERALAQLNRELESRVCERTEQLASSNLSLQAEVRTREQAEITLRQSEERFRALLTAMSDVVYSMSPNWSEMRQLLGRDFIADTNSPNQNWLQEYIHPKDHALVLAAIDEAIRTKGNFALEHQVMRVDGSLGWTFSRAVPLFDANGEIAEWLGAATDITERKLATEKLQAQLGRLALLSETTRAIGERQDLKSIFQIVVRSVEDDLPADFVCVCLYDSNDNVLKVNSVGIKSQSLTSQLAMPEQSRIAIDQNGISHCVGGHLVYEPDVASVSFPFPQRLAREGMRSLVLVPLQVESQVFGVLVAARRQPHSFSSGDCEFLKQLCEHVALAAHQAQLHVALQRAYDDLHQTQQAVMQQERLRALGQMASGIAHDINNAISPIVLYTESLLESEAGLSPTARSYLEIISHAVEDVSQTVARMREFYRQREPQLSLSLLDANRLMGQVVHLTRARWSDMPQQRGIVIDVVTDLNPGAPQMRGVESEIREAMINLVFNATDAMPDGGKLTLRTRIADGAEELGSLLHLEVQDTGIGMDDATRRRCMEPFFTTKGERGTGLGLAMVYGVIQRHSADIDIISAIGHGTTVRLIFPLAAGTVSANASVQDEARPPRVRVLVVDDDPLLTKSLRDILEADGHIVTIANGGQAGIDAFLASRAAGEEFALVITDLGMPHIDGREVARVIKHASRNTPIVLLTGWGQRLVAEGDVPANVDRVLSKPPKLRDLRKAFIDLARNPAMSRAG